MSVTVEVVCLKCGHDVGCGNALNEGAKCNQELQCSNCGSTETKAYYSCDD